MDSIDITRMLEDGRNGDPGALERLLPLVQAELHRLAANQLRRERRDHTLQPTALVNEAYLKLVDQRDQSWENREQFFGIAATLMRRVLLHHAAARRAAKRGGDQEKVPLDDGLLVFEERAIDLIALDDALSRMDEVDPEKRRIVELRFFGGLTNAEIARILDVSERTVERGWSFARAWLHKEIAGRPAADPDAP